METILFADERAKTRSSVFDRCRSFPSPLMVLDLNAIDDNVEQIRAAFPGVSLFYALKCNPHPAILERLCSLGVGFEIASQLELDQVLNAGVPATRLACFHTIKSPQFLTNLDQAGVRLLAVDCHAELEKIAQFAPNASVLVRLETGTRNSRHLLNGKFGCPPFVGLDLLATARHKGLKIAGITMHVGSQCECLQDWALATKTCSDFLRVASACGMELPVVSLGGGLPVLYTTSIPSLTSIGRSVLSEENLGHASQTRSLMIEPGRAVVASAGTLISTVIGVAERGEERWAYLDAGVYHGLIEKLQIAGGFVLPIDCEHPDRAVQTYRLAGPTCDSLDVFPGTYELPELHIGDRIAFRMAGAYSSSISTEFNGFPGPVTVLKSDLPG